MTESDETPKQEKPIPHPETQDAPAHSPGDPQRPSERLLERMRRVDPTFAKRYHQRSGE